MTPSALSNETLDELLAAAAKATPGKRKLTQFNGVPNAVMVPHPDFGGMAICTLAVHYDIHGNAEFTKLCDPETITALITELLSYRSEGPSRAATIEECAMVADEMSFQWSISHATVSYERAAEEVAAAIRALNPSGSGERG